MEKIKFFYEWDFHCLMKTFRVMRITVFLILCSIFQTLASEAYSQRTRFSLDFSETKLADVLDEIETRSEFFFLYNEKLVDTDRKVTQTFRNQRVEEILDILFADTDVVYTITDRKIILAPSYLSEKQQPQNSVSGKVTDDTDQPLPGATVVIKGTTQGTVTDINGNYLLSGIQGNTIIVYSFVGMKSQEIVVGERNSINVTLLRDYIGLDEVVAIGYGTVKKRDLTGAVSSVRMDDVLTRPAASFGDALQGQIAGVQVVQSSGRLGSDPIIQVRGLNSITAGQFPLLVIDGVPQENLRDMGVIDPTIIESIEVLKDASAAAIYGSRGGSGVILITTKKAKAGTRTFNVNFSSSLQQLPRKIPVMNAEQYMLAAKTAAQNAWVIQRGMDPNTPNTIAARGHVRYTWPQEWDDPNFRANWPSTDWHDELYRNAMMNRINISGAGGTDQLNYFFSASYHDQDGIVENIVPGRGHNLKRISLDAKVESKVTDWFRTGITVNNRLDHEKDSPVEWAIVQHAVEMPPIFPFLTEQGYPGGPTLVVNDSRYPKTTPALSAYEGHFFNNNSNPLVFMNHIDNNESNRVFGNIWGELQILDGLSFRSSFTYTNTWSQNFTYAAKDNNMPSTYWGLGQVNRSMARNNGWYFENMATYTKEFGSHRINATAGYVSEERNRMGFSASRRNYENDLTPYLSVGKEVLGASDSESTTTFASSLARVNYSLMDRYMLTATIRRDGSSRFGTDYKWGYFPSVATGWIISEENFMSGFNVIDFLKLRLSYGFTGNDNFSDYSWIPTLGQGNTVIGGKLTSFFQKGRLPNPELRWERTGQFNAGVDLTVVDSRISLTADYYNSKTIDLLLSLPISSLTGFTSLLQNVGSVKNQGLELGLTTRNITGKFNWTTITNFSLNRSEVLSLGSENFVQSGASFGMLIRSYVGQDIFQYYAYDYIGTYRDQADITSSPIFTGAKPGDAKYRDVNNDGAITTEDRTIIGSPQPDFIWSMTNRLSYKGFDFSALVVSVVGGEKVNLMRRRSMWWHGGRNFLAIMEDAWTPENPDAYHYKLSTDLTAMNNQASSYWLEDATYVKIKDITLGYTLPASLASRIGLSTIRVYLNANNVYSFDKFIGYDPEQGGSGNHIMRGFTHSEYAVPRVYTAGLNVTF